MLNNLSNSKNNYINCEAFLYYFAFLLVPSYKKGEFSSATIHPHHIGVVVCHIEQNTFLKISQI